MLEKISEESLFKTVSVIIPCYNEEKFIGKCLDSVLGNDYPRELYEISIVDGMSQDKTREILKEYTDNYDNIKLLDNPQRYTPCAFNIGIKHSDKDIIIIMGAHSDYNEDYISRCVYYLNEYGADNVGGVLKTVPREDTLIGHAVVSVLSSTFGVGNSSFRTGSDSPQWVDTVFGGCYRRSVFDEIGMFNEKLINSQDIEFNNRLRKAGGKILLVPTIISIYNARSDLVSFFKHNFRNGIWAILPVKYTGELIGLRHTVPLLFVLGLIVILGLTFISPFFLWMLLTLCGLYLGLALGFSLKSAITKGEWRFVILMPLLFFSLHFMYGLGSIRALFKLSQK